MAPYMSLVNRPKAGTVWLGFQIRGCAADALKAGLRSNLASYRDSAGLYFPFMLDTRHFLFRYTFICYYRIGLFLICFRIAILIS